MSESKKVGEKLRKAIAFLLLVYGVAKILYFAFSFPSGDWIDWAVLIQVTMGAYYVFSGSWMIMTRPSFQWVWIILFVGFILEISQLGTYQSHF